MRNWFQKLLDGYPKIVAEVKADASGAYRFKFCVIKFEHDGSPDTIAVSSIEDKYPTGAAARKVIRAIGFDGDIITRGE